jgi:hypothetical protein
MRGAILDLTMNTTTQARLGMGNRDRLLDMLSLQLYPAQTVRVDDAAFQKMAVTSDDETWTRRLIEDPIASRTILRMLASPGPLELRQVLFRPGSVTFRLYHTRIRDLSQDKVRTWLGDLAALARTAESIPASRYRMQARNQDVTGMTAARIPAGENQPNLGLARKMMLAMMVAISLLTLLGGLLSYFFGGK